MEIHQFTPALLYGDAIGNHAMLIRQLLREAGYRSEIYTQHIDPHYKDEAYPFREFAEQSDAIVIYHHAIGSDVADYVSKLPNLVVPYYHNITPPECFLGFNKGLGEGLRWGRTQLLDFANRPYALAGSEYNREELLQTGYTKVDVLPYSVDFKRINADIDTIAAQNTRNRLNDGKINWLFVGRMVPNKRQDHVLRAFRHYHTVVNPNSRLILIGSDQTAPAYGWAVRQLAERLGIANDVHFVGRVGNDASLGAYYQAAHVFVCLSEHEGFCVPLIEAMHFDVPIVALARAAVPYTLGNAGVILAEARFDMIAEMVDLLQTDRDLRQQIILTQRQRLNAFTVESVRAQLFACIEQMLRFNSDHT